MIRALILATICCGLVACGGAETTSTPAASSGDSTAASDATNRAERTTAKATTADACALLSASTIGEIFGAEAGTIEAREDYAGDNGGSCSWTFRHDGLKTIVQAHVRVRTSASQGVDPMLALIEYYLANGNAEAGSSPTAYEASNLAGKEHGALSEEFGNRYSKGRAFAWAEPGRRFVKVSVVHTLEEEGIDLVVPEVGLLESLAEAVGR